MMQTIFYNFFITAEKPSYSLRMSLISGVINIVLISLYRRYAYGVAGAAVATAMGEYVGGLVPLIYFARKITAAYRLVKPVWRKDILLKTCLNGSSEFMTNASSSVVICFITAN
ncbi:MAG: polysaccharide biosynthesis C-terminal domain-containing protein [Anaerostipes hadrus]